MLLDCRTGEGKVKILFRLPGRETNKQGKQGERQEKNKEEKRKSRKSGTPHLILFCLSKEREKGTNKQADK